MNYVVDGCSCSKLCQCQWNFERLFYKTDFVKHIYRFGRRSSLVNIACHYSEYDIGFLMVRTLTREDAKKIVTVYNETPIHMEWTQTLVYVDGILCRDNPTKLLRQEMYARHVVDILGCDVNKAQISPPYDACRGQHPIDFNPTFTEEYNPNVENRGGYTSLMTAMRRRSFRMAGVLADLGADWHTLVNASGLTAYQMIKIEAAREMFVYGPSNTATLRSGACLIFFEGLAVITPS